ncbi:MAG: hypothetical protein QG629_670 [Patescibacteria group bacterium]|nr:hypothetical protein [Candidatus Saccharibacteria bacterium]MDQ5963588.1 hypothetical protein [Patescibacteria group bacterium]
MKSFGAGGEACQDFPLATLQAINGFYAATQGEETGDMIAQQIYDLGVNSFYGSRARLVAKRPIEVGEIPSSPARRDVQITGILKEMVVISAYGESHAIALRIQEIESIEYAKNHLACVNSRVEAEGMLGTPVNQDRILKVPVAAISKISFLPKSMA